MATARLFEALADETPPTTGEEIGAALAPALAEIAAAGERQAQVLAQAIAQAMSAAQPATAEAPRQITHWTFDVERDERGNMTRVTAQAASHGAH